MDKFRGVLRYAVSFPLTRPVLVRPLTENEQKILAEHGCAITPFPEKYPSLLKGHMVTFPAGAELEEVTTAQYNVRFGDGYSPTLIWEGGWYQFSQVVAGNGHLVS